MPTLSSLLVLALASSLQLLLPSPTEAASFQLELNSTTPPFSLNFPDLERKQSTATTYYQVDEFAGATFFE